MTNKTLVITLLGCALASCGTLGTPSIAAFTVTSPELSISADPCPGGLQATLTADGTVIESPKVASGTRYMRPLDLSLIRKGAVFRVQARCLDAGGNLLQQNIREITLQEDLNPRSQTYSVEVLPPPVSGTSDVRCQDSTQNNANAPCIYILGK